MKERFSNHPYVVLFLFWMPLAFTWLMMSVEGPYLSAVIARLADAKYNLAAYGVAFSLALIIEAPIIMIISASIALVKDSYSLKKMFRYTLFLNTIITIAMVILLIPTVFYFLAIKVIGLPPEIARLTYGATAILIPWPAAIGFRRFYQGILIHFNLTRRVAYGTVIRLFSMGATAFSTYHSGLLPGALVGALALSCGVTMEALASRLMVWRQIKLLKSITLEEEQSHMSYREIHRFYTPLMMTSLLSLGAHPIVTFFMGQSRMSVESLAVLPVINSLVFIFRSLGLSLQEIVIARLGKQFEQYHLVRNFSIALGIFVTLALGSIAFSPLATLWYRSVSGLSPELTQFAILPTRILILLPALAVWISFQRGVLVAGRMTGPITMATTIELGGIIIILLIAIQCVDVVGVLGAATAYIIGRVSADIYLIKPNYMLKKKFFGK